MPPHDLGVWIETGFIQGPTAHKLTGCVGWSTVCGPESVCGNSRLFSLAAKLGQRSWVRGGDFFVGEVICVMHEVCADDDIRI